MKDTHGGDIWGAARSSGASPEDFIDFSSSINPLGPPVGALRAAVESLSLSSSYPEPVPLDLTRVFSSFHGISPEEALPGNGSTEFIYLIPGVLRPSTALIVEPAFSEYRKSLKVQGPGPRIDAFITKEKDGFLPDLERLGRALQKRYSVLYVANPANPTGALLRKGTVLHIVRECRKRGTIVIVDEAFIDFSEEESVKGEAGRLPNLVVLRSMTKFFAMAGLRLGFAVANKRLMRKLASVKAPWSVNNVAVAAGLAALRDGDYARRTAEAVPRERERLVKGLSSIGGLKVYPSPANYLMVKIAGKGVTAQDLKTRLLRKRILIRDLSAFRGLGKYYFRVSVRNPRDNETLVGALKEVLKDPGRGI